MAAEKDNGDSIVDGKDDCPSLGLADGSKNSEEPWRSTEARPNPKTEQDQHRGTGPSRTEARPKVPCGAPRRRREAGEEHRGRAKSEDRAGPASRNRAKSEDRAGPATRNGTKQKQGDIVGFERNTEAKARRARGGQTGARVGAKRREQERDAVVEPDGDNGGVRYGARESRQRAVDSGRTHATLASSPQHQHVAGAVRGQRRRHHRGEGQEGSRGGAMPLSCSPQEVARTTQR